MSICHLSFVTCHLSFVILGSTGVFWGGKQLDLVDNAKQGSRKFFPLSSLMSG